MKALEESDEEYSDTDNNRKAFDVEADDKKEVTMANLNMGSSSEVQIPKKKISSDAYDEDVFDTNEDRSE